MAEPLLKIEELETFFPIKSGIFKRTVAHVKAVNNISFDVKEKETFSLVGESGCGKSTLGRSILRILEPTGGKVLFDNENILNYSSSELRKLRRDVQLVFQDPYSSLNPRMSVRELVSEPLFTHFSISKEEANQQVDEMLEKVGLPLEQAERYPHQFSGGQRQRISIARAFILKPKFVVADEPVSALDVSIQAQILKLLMQLQEEFNMTYLFISHDLNVVKHISDRVGVMYLGKMMEMTDTDSIYDQPLHPYTQALLSAVPKSDPLEEKERVILKGDVPSPANPPSGCPFHQRCPKAMDECTTIEPEFKEVKENHFVACHLY
ncbi:dipeptide ABC transporter ATP-binding protein [Pontibacillus yanchengensis]|uniref:Dipeptide ABC transporter ATP-binding protein n=1 Tax=Pontibacillus yanchengensis TaxID=462910 RepID=A0ACC7VGM9_9BACI|nr:dipeptide ABC transporter ATP-binding protein [Pontibacillus yanchengensis]MYL53942.1 dipeptide ABC transporter ATP-binding protein [Pontibacillus yanchengensis]